MILKFACKLVRAPIGSFLAALLSELRQECMHTQDAWLCGVHRLLSVGLSFPPSACRVLRVNSMLQRLRQDNPRQLMEVFVDQFSAASVREARARLAGRPGGPYHKLRILQSWVGRAPPRFCMQQLSFSRQSFNFLVRLMIGELPVNRIRAMFQYRTSLGDLGETWFGKRTCLHCLLSCDTLVLDSEWHRVFDFPHFADIRVNMSDSFSNTLKSIQRRDGFTIESDICTLLKAIQKDSQLDFSLASFIRQAISRREGWFSEVCVRRRLCVSPDHWPSNLLQDPPRAAELPDDFERTFTDGKPWFFDPHIFGQ